ATAEGANGEEGRYPQRPARHREGAHDEGAATEHTAAVEVLLELVDVLLAARELVAVLDIGAGWQQVLAPRHEADSQAAERHREEQAFELGLSAVEVHDRETYRRQGGDAEGSRHHEFRSALAHGVGSR